MKLQSNLEQCFGSIAALQKKSSIVLCDKGLMDYKVQMEEENWQMLLDEIGWNVVTMRDRRYDMIIHLVTSAKGAKDYFNLPENKEKFQDGMKTAQIIDTNTINAWIGHPNF